jgi:hypothetical protein
MTKKSRIHPSDVHGIGRLAVDATLGLTNLVEAVHHTIARAPSIIGTPTSAPASGIAGLVYENIRRVTQVVGASLDALLAQLIPD